MIASPLFLRPRTDRGSRLGRARESVSAGLPTSLMTAGALRERPGRSGVRLPDRRPPSAVPSREADAQGGTGTHRGPRTPPIVGTGARASVVGSSRMGQGWHDRNRIRRICRVWPKREIHCAAGQASMKRRRPRYRRLTIRKTNRAAASDRSACPPRRPHPPSSPSPPQVGLRVISSQP